MSLLIKISVPDREEKVEMVELPAKFGRAPDCDISLSDEGISRYHFLIEKEGGKIILRDLGSRNGTFLNGKEVSTAYLNEGDIITAGSTSFEIIEARIFQQEDFSEIFKNLLKAPEDEIIKRLTKAEGYRIFLEGKSGKRFIRSTGISERDFADIDSTIKSLISSEHLFLKKGDFFYIKIQTDELRGGISLLNPAFTDYDLLSPAFSIIAMKMEMNVLREKLKNLERYLPLDILITSDLSLREITVLFCDLAGFTGRCERASLKEIAEFIKFYYSILNRIASEQGGIVNKFLGDGAMIIFGASVFTKGHQVDAVKAAIMIKEEMRRVLFGGEEVKIRTGINTGICLVGGIEAGERMEWTVIGDVVNVASRLQGMASPGQILIGEETWRVVREDFSTKYVGTISLKGRRSKTRIYEVL